MIGVFQVIGRNQLLGRHVQIAGNGVKIIALGHLVETVHVMGRDDLA